MEDFQIHPDSGRTETPSSEDIKEYQLQTKILRKGKYCMAYHFMTLCLLLLFKNISKGPDCGTHTRQLLEMGVYFKLCAILHYLFKSRCIDNKTFNLTTVERLSGIYHLWWSGKLKSLICLVWHWTVVENFLYSKNQCLHKNAALWGGHVLLLAEALVIAFSAGAYLIQTFSRLTEDSHQTTEDKVDTANSNAKLVDELAKLKNFIYSHFKDTCGICSKSLKVDDMVIVPPCGNDHIVHYECHATSTGIEENCEICPGSDAKNQGGNFKIIPFAELLNKKYAKMEADKKLLKARKKRKYSCTDF